MYCKKCLKYPNITEIKIYYNIYKNKLIKKIKKAKTLHYTQLFEDNKGDTKTSMGCYQKNERKGEQQQQ